MPLLSGASLERGAGPQRWMQVLARAGAKSITVVVGLCSVSLLLHVHILHSVQLPEDLTVL